jgi:hypothetical protein
MAGRHRAQKLPRGRHRAPRPHPHRGAASLAAITVLSGIGAGSAWWALQGSPHHPGAAHQPRHTHTAELAVTAGHRHPATSSTGGATAPPSPAAAAPALVLRTLGATSWIAVDTADGTTLIARDVPPHQRLVFRQHHLTVTLGNAGAVAVAIDGQRIAPAGASGEVRHLTVP